MRVIVAFVVACLFSASVAVSGAGAQQYRLQVGDTVAVSVWQDAKLDRELIVGPDGTISFPFVGRIEARGQTLAALERLLKDRLQPNYREALDVTATLTRFEDPDETDIYYVTGEVNQPGAFELDTPRDLMQAIAQAGGFSTFAATQRIAVHRRAGGVDTLFHFNYRDFISGQDFSGNIGIRSGDVIVVPEKNLLGY